jgi:hypothetical protein
MDRRGPAQTGADRRRPAVFSTPAFKSQVTLFTTWDCQSQVIPHNLIVYFGECRKIAVYSSQIEGYPSENWRNKTPVAR